MPFLMLVEMTFHAEGEPAFAAHLPRMVTEIERTAGCLALHVATAPGGRYAFTSLWSDDAALQRWVDNPFHRDVLMPGFRQWATESWFSRWDPADDQPRVRRCPQCGRWTRGRPGWDAAQPDRCRQCGAALGPSDG